MCLTDPAMARMSAATVGYFSANSSNFPSSTSAGMTPGHSVLAPRNQRPCPSRRAVWKVLPGNQQLHPLAVADVRSDDNSFGRAVGVQ